MAEKPMYSRPKKTSHLHTILYEIDMLRFCLNGLRQGGKNEGTKNLLIEGFLLHYRNLVRVFSGANHRPGDLSVAAPRLWAQRELTLNETKAIALKATALERNYFNVISTYLQHCTEARFELQQVWNVEAMYEDMAPIIESFEKAFRVKATVSTEGGHQAEANSTVSFSTFAPGTLDRGKPE